jgi:hypothetical protein
MVQGGGDCLTCHKGQEAKLGDKIVKGGPLEPTPPAGKNGSLALNVQVAYDDQHAYLRFQWKTKNSYPGDGYPYYRFDGKEWKAYGAPRLSAPAYKGEQPAIYEDRMSMLIDDGSVPNFDKQGCWVTCHDGERDNPGQPKPPEVAANPFYQAIMKARAQVPACHANRCERAPLEPRGYGRRRLRARLAQLRRRRQPVLFQHGRQDQAAALHV